MKVVKNKSCWNWILILISICTYGQKESITLFENEKFKISFQDGALKQKYHHQKNDDNVYDTISIRLFPIEKIYLGKETAKNFNLKATQKKYLKKAMELENRKFHDVDPGSKNFKILHELRNNYTYFYYYFTRIYSSRTMNFGRYESKSNKDYDCWMYYGNDPFWFEFTLNGRVVVWKKYAF